MSNDSRVSLKHLMYVWYKHPDLEGSHKFMKDFGLITVKEEADKIWYRGFGDHAVCYISERADGSNAEFLGGGWAVDTYEDLEKATKVRGASDIYDADETVGGKMVKLQDPAGGSIYVHWGQAVRSTIKSEKPKKLVYNTWDEKNRKGDFQRFEDGPSHVHKLGHYGYEVHGSQYTEVLNWYLKTFTLATTDSIFHPGNGQDIMTFIHLDKGEQFVDHHNFFLAGRESDLGGQAHHSSFEVDDIDSELKGHQYLKKQGWTLVHGVGRHMLGSQLFDYWFDNSGFVVEHYADGDMVNCNNPPQRVPAGPDSVAIWGPRIPVGFFTRKKEDLDKFLPDGPPGPPGPPGPSQPAAPEMLPV